MRKFTRVNEFGYVDLNQVNYVIAPIDYGVRLFLIGNEEDDYVTVDLDYRAEVLRLLGIESTEGETK